MKRLKILLIFCVLCVGCSRFHNAPNESTDARYVVISPIYNEIIWALGAQDKVVGIDLSTTYPPEVKNVQTVGYHRALSAEGILSLHPTAIIHDNNIGPPKLCNNFNN
jgi:iron complex transport system substrate-binding protein